MNIKLMLIVILLIASCLRLWNLSANPPGLTWDEAALGYNAYSIMLTGRDEYGTLLPLHLKSFGDYKPALYAYLDIPFIAIFGLNEWGVRLPSALIGVLTVLFSYLLVQLLFKRQLLSLLTAFFIAVSPFAIQFSRPAFEANLAVFLNLSGVYFFIKGLNNKKYLSLSLVIFNLSLLSYQASRIFVPLILLLLIYLFKDKLSKKIAFTALTIFFSFFVMLMSYTYFSGQTGRLSTLNYFAYQRPEEQINLISSEDKLSENSIEFLLLHGEWWSYIRGLLERYFVYFSPKMLALEGDYSPRHKVPDLGALYYFSIILIPLGLAFLIKQNSNAGKLLIGWLLLAPMPAVLSRDLINMLRAFNMLVPLEFLQAAGLLWIFDRYKSRKITLKIFITIFTVVFSINFFVFLDRYFIHAPIEYSKYWLYGYKDAVNTLNEQTKKFEKIIFTNFYGQPYIYYLFYTKYDPSKYQQHAKLEQKSVDVGDVKKIDNISFSRIDWRTQRGDKNTLFIGTQDEMPDQDTFPFPEYKVLKDVKFLNGEVAFRILETK